MLSLNGMSARKVLGFACGIAVAIYHAFVLLPLPGQ